MKKPVALYTGPGRPDCAAVYSFFTERKVVLTQRDLSDRAVAEEAKRCYSVRLAPITVIREEVSYGTFEQQHNLLEDSLP